MNCTHAPDWSCPDCRPELWHPANAAQDTIAWLADRILTAKRAYYAGAPIMSDHEYDALETSLRAYAPDHAALRQVGSEELP